MIQLPATEYVEGLRELDMALTKFPTVLTKKVLRDAMKKGGYTIRDEMKVHAPRHEGGPKHPGLGPLWKRIGLSARFLPRDPSVLIKVKPSSKVSFYARFYEYGTSHQPARPWARPAWEKQKRAALEAIISELRAGVKAMTTVLRSSAGQ